MENIEFRKYLSYNRFDIVHENSSRGFPVPSPDPASTYEEPSTWVHQHFRYHPTMVARDNLKLHSPPSLALAGVCRIP